ncbi:ATP-binding protein [Corynebacterium sp. sy039]|uniref:ATP-binding protein n=1 Tax=Corynebacterium sp. sy039 TaxID=2599641 RepID=UPI0011B75A8B|nr:ATP-binding protein [Corynebacterium sp. sy039]QDZ42475.1 ATP-binding protein [Corynebacterium sp. sy039]
METTVYSLKALRRGYQVSSVRNGSKEIDFRITQAETEAFIQVAYQTNNDDTLNRELAAFNGTPPGVPCFLITADLIPPQTGTITHVDALSFLAGDPLPMLGKN